MKTIPLSKLSEEWKTKYGHREIEGFDSKSPLVDGTAFTTNPEIKERRKRIVSEVKHATKRPKIAEFINACKFLTGQTDTIYPLSTQHCGLLSIVRNNGNIPETYKSAINNNLDLVVKAAELKPRQIKEYYSNAIRAKEKTKVPATSFEERLASLSSTHNPIAQHNTTVIDISSVRADDSILPHRKSKQPLFNNSKNRRVSEVAGQKFEAWLLEQFAGSRRPHRLYASYVNSYNHTNGQMSSTTPVYAKLVLCKYEDKIKEYTGHCGLLIQNDIEIQDRTKASAARLEKTAKFTERVQKWLKAHLDLTNDKKEFVYRYFIILRHYLLYGTSNWPTSYSTNFINVFEQFKDELANVKVDMSNRRLIRIKDNIEEQAMPKQESQTIEQTIEQNQNRQSHSIDDTLSLLIALAKKAGATELTIKL